MVGLSDGSGKAWGLSSSPSGWDAYASQPGQASPVSAASPGIASPTSTLDSCSRHSAVSQPSGQETMLPVEAHGLCCLPPASLGPGLLSDFQNVYSLHPR